jgi:hypothetical protein
MDKLVISNLERNKEFYAGVIIFWIKTGSELYLLPMTGS